jgi:hypothetical protein
MNPKPIIVVSGLPRSGTSLMMQLLRAGGLAILTDGERTPDEDNPQGYYELEAVKRTEDDPSWLDGAEGKVVKVISKLLPALPADRPYRVVFMRRRLDEILASQRRMLERRREPLGDDQAMRTMFAAHVEQVERWFKTAPHIAVRFVSYNRLVAEPSAQIARVAEFVGPGLDLAAMERAVNLALYRNRA